MRIAIVTSGRFHVLDLARELDALGHDVAFYSYVPRSRAQRFGLPGQCHRSLLPYLIPLVAAQKIGLPHFRDRFNQMTLCAIDRLAATVLEPCDVFIGMSGLCIRSAKAARQKYGAKVWIERGSRHILSQKEILEAMPGQGRKKAIVPEYAVQRELAGYELADTIVVPARHAKESFIERGFPDSMLFRNPYGVDLSMFPPTPVPDNVFSTILYVGAWSLQKGCDILVKAWQKLESVRLIHVGTVSDMLLPGLPGFEHYDAVPQWQLKDFQARAHVFVLASRQDGFGMVLSQALACGLPVVCTDRTGGEDLRESFGMIHSCLTVVPHDNPEALADALKVALDRARRQRGIRNILGTARKKLSWRAYGERYANALRERVALKMGHNVKGSV